MVRGEIVIREAWEKDTSLELEENFKRTLWTLC